MERLKPREPKPSAVMSCGIASTPILNEDQNMPIETFDIFFSGKLLEGFSVSEVKEQIGRQLKLNSAQLEHLFSGQEIRIKSAVDQETAVRYRIAFRDAGALLEIRPAAADNSASTTVPKEPKPASDDLTLLPPRTGSLIDCAPEVAAQPLPDISSLSLSAQDRNLDESEQTPPPAIDTSALSLTPANSGSLEDCIPPTKPAPLPDISNLRLEEREPPKPQREEE